MRDVVDEYQIFDCNRIKCSSLKNVCFYQRSRHRQRVTSIKFLRLLDLYLNELVDETKAREHIKREFHLIDELKCKLLMNLNIMISEKIIINLTNKSLIISTCENLLISIRVNLKSNSRIRRIVHSKKSIMLFSNSIVNISTYLREKKLSSNRDFLFESNCETLITSFDEMNDLYTHVCDCNIAFVHVRNELLESMIISSKTRFELFTKYEEENCFQIDEEYHEWAIISNEFEVEKNFQ
jgi:hypothetical protein